MCENAVITVYIYNMAIKVIFCVPPKKNLKVRNTGSILGRSGVNYFSLHYQVRLISLNVIFISEKKNPIRDVTVLRPMGVCDI